LPTRLIRTCVKRRPSPWPGLQLRGYLDSERELRSRSFRRSITSSSRAPLFSSFNSFIGHLCQEPFSDTKDRVGDVAERDDVDRTPADVHTRALGRIPNASVSQAPE
jgi:hypothetical protein